MKETLSHAHFDSIIKKVSWTAVDIFFLIGVELFQKAVNKEQVDYQDKDLFQRVVYKMN